MTLIDEWTEVLVAADPTLSIREAREVAEQLMRFATKFDCRDKKNEKENAASKQQKTSRRHQA